MTTRQKRTFVGSLATAYDALLQIEEVNIFDQKIMGAKKIIRRRLAEALLEDEATELGTEITLTQQSGITTLFGGHR